MTVDTPPAQGAAMVHHPRFAKWPERAYRWSVLWIVVSALAIHVVGGIGWAGLLVPGAVVLVVCPLVRRQTLFALYLRIRHGRAPFHRPFVVNEDGDLSHPMPYPNEVLQVVACGGCGRFVFARLIDARTGKSRASRDWPHGEDW